MKGCIFLRNTVNKGIEDYREVCTAYCSTMDWRITKWIATSCRARRGLSSGVKVQTVLEPLCQDPSMNTFEKTRCSTLVVILGSVFQQTDLHTQ